MSEYRIGEVARLSGVSVRTLHHYDQIGLLVPSGRTEAGYRQYSPGDVRRLQQILYYRELELGLETIAEMLADPATGVDEHLRRQHRLVRERLARAERLLTAIETEMEARQMGISLTAEEQLEVFGTDQLPDYETEAQARWGTGEAWKESQRRTAAYTKDDWLAIKREADENVAGFAEALAAGQPPEGEAARALAEEHRRHISSRFYECSHERHCGLAELYVSDPRFAQRYDGVAAGLARYVHDAILANAAAAAR